jgi:hypothetical protein
MYSMIVLLRIGGRSIDLSIRQSTKEVLISSAEILSASQSVEEVSIFLDKDPLASPSLLVSSARRLEESISTPSTGSPSVEGLSAKARSVRVSNTLTDTQLSEGE